MPSSSDDDDDDDDDDKDEYDDDNKDEDNDETLNALNDKLCEENVRLQGLVKEYRIRIRDLTADLQSYKRAHRQTKRQIRTDNNWNGEDANISDKVSSWVKTYLFQHWKFLTSNWMEYSDSDTSLSSYTRKKLNIKCDDYKDVWDRVICPTINAKYNTIRSNLSSEIRKAYRSK